jgi:hypothetical protein
LSSAARAMIDTRIRPESNFESVLWILPGSVVVSDEKRMRTSSDDVDGRWLGCWSSQMSDPPLHDLELLVPVDLLHTAPSHIQPVLQARFSAWLQLPFICDGCQDRMRITYQSRNENKERNPGLELDLISKHTSVGSDLPPISMIISPSPFRSPIIPIYQQSRFFS